MERPEGSIGVDFLGGAGAPAWIQARVGKDFLEKIRRKARKFFFSLPTLDLIAWVGKNPHAII